MKEITVRDFFGVLESYIEVRIIMSELRKSGNETWFDDTILFEGMRPCTKDKGELDDDDIDEDFEESLLDLKVLLVCSEYDKRNGEVIPVIYVRPPKTVENTA